MSWGTGGRLLWYDKLTRTYTMNNFANATQGRFFRTSRGQDQFTKESLIRDACLGPSAKRQRLEVRKSMPPSR